MGVKISKPADKTDSQAELTYPNIGQKCEFEIKSNHEPQTNGNATKLADRERSFMYSPSERSISSRSSGSSVRRPKLGSSPVPIIGHGTETKRLLPNCDLFRSEKGCSSESTPRTLDLDSRPPWRPSAVSSSQSFHAEKNRLRIVCAEKSNNFAALANQNNRPLGMNPRMSRKAISTSTFSCIYDAQLQTGRAHLRRCTAAQQVRAQQPDVWESFSVDCCMTPPIKSLHSSRRQAKSQCRPSTRDIRRPTSNQLLNGLLRKDHFYVKSNTKPSQPKEAGDIPVDSYQTCSYEHPGAVAREDDVYPLRYVFYVEDKPGSVKAFSNGGRIYNLAHDSHCRVYFHAQCMETIGLGGPERSDCQAGERIIEPALFYQGKRIRPVTVAAQNMTDLRNFIEKLDYYYPEFEASLFLDKQLNVSPASCLTGAKFK